MDIPRETRERFWGLVQGYEQLPAETRQRITFEQYAEGQDQLEEARARSRAFREAAARADLHSSDVDPLRVDPWADR